jgi:DNA polymerase (family 10)
MPILNQNVASTFEELADFLEIDGANPFRIRAYRNAARTIGDLGEELSVIHERGDDLTGVEGIGKDLAAKIEEILRTGTLEALLEIQERIPASLGELLRLSGLGPKRVKVFFDDLGIKSLDDLEAAAREGGLRDLPGMGKKTEEKLLKAIASRRDASKRFLRAEIAPVADALMEHLEGSGFADRLTLAGSYRRSRETVGDLDILAVSEKAELLMEVFVAYEDVVQVLAQGKTKSSVTMRSGLQVDLRVIPDASYGAALHYFTGSQAHNIAMRRRAQERGLKMNEYGVFKEEEPVAGDTESGIFSSVGLSEIPPELREGRGEIEAAENDDLPELLDVKMIRGDLHAHSTASDGRDSIEKMAEAAKELGYEYFGVTDHSKRLTVANGLDEIRLAGQIDEIDALNAKGPGIHIFKSIEVDILEEGALDLSDDILERLDYVIGSVHSRFNLSREKQTERVLRAMDNKYFSILGHPTGRLLLSRDPYEIDVPRIIEHAKQRGCFLELNANPHRLDLHDVYCRMAAEAGVLVAVNTDAHRTRHFNYMEHGVGQARRGWLRKRDALNTRSLAQLRKLLRDTMGG